jgi:hypothetical protein
MRRLACLATACLGALALAACGGGGDKGDKGLPKAQYVKQANAICTGNNQVQKKLVARGFKDAHKPTAKEAQAFLGQFAATSRGALRTLQDIPKPKGDKDTLNKIYAAVDRGVTKAEIASEDPHASLALLKTNKGPFDEANKLARSYGLTTCAQ